jgi:ribosome-binding factor A
LRKSLGRYKPVLSAAALFPFETGPLRYIRPLNFFGNVSFYHMASRRTLKVAEAIREVLGMAILAEIKDPRVQHVTITRVEVTPDMKRAVVHISIMGSETQQQLCLHGLKSSAGFLQSKVAKGIDMRYTPRIEFEIDQGVKKSIEISRILREVLPPSADGTAAETATMAADENEAASVAPISHHPAVPDSSEDNH